MEQKTRCCFSSMAFSWPSLLLILPSLFFICILSSAFSPFPVAIPILILSIIFLFRFTKRNDVSCDFLVHTQNQIQGEQKSLLEKGTDAESQSDGSVKEHGHDVESPEEGSSKSERIDDPGAKGEDLRSHFVCSSNESQNVEMPLRVHQSLPFSDASSPDGDEDDEEEEDDDDDDEEEEEDDDDDEEEEEDDDDDSLIEIALPDAASSFDEEGEVVQSQSPCLSDFLHFERQEQDMMELLADMNAMNEEENLIEIDISVGSIKTSI